MTTPLRQNLTLIDALILSVIFFGFAIYSSTAAYLNLLAEQQIAPDNLTFGDSENGWGMVSELFWLTIAAIYLRWRRFDFKQLNFKANRWTLPKTLLYIVLAGSVATGYEILQAWAWPQWYPDPAASAAYSADNHFAMWSPLFMAFALLNGFFEEVFFIGLIVLVEKKHLAWAIVFSLFVRFAFHTYQGLAGALTITTLGIVYLLLRRKSDELWPFMLAHSFFDLFGLGLPVYLLD